MEVVRKIQVYRIDHTTKAEFVQVNKNLFCLVDKRGFLHGGVGETRTLAPVTRPTPLAGVPRHQLEYYSIIVTFYLLLN